jgi:hypothetical protein
MKAKYEIGTLIKFKNVGIDTDIPYGAEPETLIGEIESITYTIGGFFYFAKGRSIDESQIIASYTQDKIAKPRKKRATKIKIESEVTSDNL